MILKEYTYTLRFNALTVRAKTLGVIKDEARDVWILERTRPTARDRRVLKLAPTVRRILTDDDMELRVDIVAPDTNYELTQAVALAELHKAVNKLSASLELWVSRMPGFRERLHV